MNLKARKVRQSTLEMLGKHVDVEDLYITRTVEQSDESIDEIIECRYPLVFCGGGDGTAMRVMEQMHKKVIAHNEAGGSYEVPKFGLLKLGTGNGWAGLLNVPPHVKPIWAIRRARSVGELTFATFNMIECDDRLFHFGGFGVDALILNDYIDLKRWFTKGPLWRVGNSLWCYLLALVFKSIPKVLKSGFMMNVRITNESDEPVYRVSHTGGIQESPFAKGDVLYEGPTLIVGLATTCNYGFKLKVYPHALKKPGYMNLRLCCAPVPTILRNIRKLWLGRYEHPDLYDFLVKDVSVELEEEAPFQLGGDPEGYRKGGRFRVSDLTVDVLDFRGYSCHPS